mmetsp:Transcript_16895/g.38012  ORF Transcript_16895/g.38012 Transcript_16895/m.38012 type:complete len:120 (-) Transcript_16895:1780-2139(-)
MNCILTCREKKNYSVVTTYQHNYLEQNNFFHDVVISNILSISKKYHVNTIFNDFTAPFYSLSTLTPIRPGPSCILFGIFLGTHLLDHISTSSDHSASGQTFHGTHLGSYMSRRTTFESL